MKLANVLESGITGAATLTVLREALDQVDPKGPNRSFLQKKGIIKQLKKSTHKKGIDAVKLYIKLATELLGVAGYMGLSALGKKKNSMLRGAALGGIAGIVSVLLNDMNKDQDPTLTDAEIWRNRITTVALYILGGLVAGATVKMIRKAKNK